MTGFALQEVAKLSNLAHYIHNLVLPLSGIRYNTLHVQQSSWLSLSKKRQLLLR